MLFALGQNESIDDLIEASTTPLSVILQVTKRCDFDCNFCSETLQMKDPTLEALDTIRTNLAGVQRVFLSGGEPLLRRDFGDIVDMYTEDFILGIPTNATKAHRWADRLVGKVAYINVGLEGTRAITNRVRGDYDTVMAGVRAFQEHGLPVSLSSVVLRSTLHGLPFLYQIADILDAGKVKLILPLRKGNATNLDENEFIDLDESAAEFSRLAELRTTHNWRPALRMTAWTPETEGHMICIEPNGKANAWPVYDGVDLFEPLGNVLKEYAKYLGKSIRTSDRQDRVDV